MNIKSIAFTVFFCLICLISCETKPELEHSAAIVIKGREVKMTMYGPYYDVLNQWTEVEFVLNKISENHAVKKILIRIAPLKNYEKDNMFAEYAIMKVTRYFNSRNITYEIKDERKK